VISSSCTQHTQNVYITQYVTTVLLMQQHSTAQHSTAQHSTAQHSTTACRTNRSPAIDSLFCTPIRANLPHLNRKQKEHLQCPGQLQLLHHLDKGAGVIPHACLIARTQLELTHKGGQLRPVTDQQGLPVPSRHTDRCQSWSPAVPQQAVPAPLKTCGQ